MMYHDLNVPIPTSSSSSPEQLSHRRLMIDQISIRLKETGYNTMALTHTVYGYPKSGVDDAKIAIPEAIMPKANRPGNNDQGRKRRKTENSGQDGLLRRLQTVVENVSDVGSFCASSFNVDSRTRSPICGLLKDYDLVSLSPRNDASFQAACAASEVDIVTLDYTSGRGGVQLPYRIRPADVRSVVQRGAALEIPYAAAMLNVHQRKALVQTVYALQLASMGVRPKPLVIVSSGDRKLTAGEDIGAMALRSPGDLTNFLAVVLGFDSASAEGALGISARSIVKRGEMRRMNQLGGGLTVIVTANETEVDTTPKQEATSQTDMEDGFINLS